MKSYICLLLSLGLTFSSFAQKRIVATASMIADMAKNIVGDKCIVECIVPIGGDPHIFQPTPLAARMASNADLILKNGLTFEGWLNELIENSGTSAEIVLVTEGVDAITSLIYENASDPHAWMDAENGIIYAENIKNALIRMDPENSSYYEANFNKYKDELIQLDLYIQREINKIPQKQRVLITSHDAFQYYGIKYGLQLESILGTSTDAQEQTSDILRVNKVIRETGVPAVFVESTVNPKMLTQIAKDNKIQIGGKLYADSIGEEDSPANSYINMLKYNTDIIVNGLTAQTEESLIEEMTAQDPNKTQNYVLYGIIGLLLIAGFWFMVRKLK